MPLKERIVIITAFKILASVVSCVFCKSLKWQAILKKRMYQNNLERRYDVKRIAKDNQICMIISVIPVDISICFF